MKRINMIGFKHGRYSVIEFSHIKKEGTHFRTYWKCLCECGNTRTLSRDNLLISKSCGCYRDEQSSKRAVGNKYYLKKKRLYKTEAIGILFRQLKKYSMRLDDWHKCIQIQAGKCVHCERAFSPTNLPVVDHSHKTGLWRAIVCQYCNLTIGFMEKDPDWWKGLMQNYAPSYVENMHQKAA